MNESQTPSHPQWECQWSRGFIPQGCCNMLAKQARELREKWAGQTHYHPCKKAGLR